MVRQEILETTLLGNTLQEYLIAFAIFILLVGTFKIIQGVIITNIKKLTKRTRNQFDDIILGVVKSISWPCYVYIAIYIGTRPLVLHHYLDKTLYVILLIVILFYAVRALQSIIKYGRDKLMKKSDKNDDTIIKFTATIISALLWILAFLLLLQNLGYNVSTLIAGLGVGGIAIAFALQAVLSDVFASISIHFDKPFRVGDFIVIGSDMGTVEKIGIKSTRIRTLQGQELIVANKDLTDSRINNFKKMEKRRVVFTIGVTYNTPKKKLEKIPQIITKIIDKVKDADIDRVHFKSFGASSMDFETVYHVVVSDYAKYMDIQQEINLALVAAFEKEKIEFAFPTQTIYVKK